MRFTFRARLMAVVAVSAFALLVLVVAGSIVAGRAERNLLSIQDRFLPKVELRPELEKRFDKLHRGLQDAVAASDAELLAETQAQKLNLLKLIASAQAVVEPDAREALRSAIEDYYDSAHGVSNRLIHGETGEAIVRDMAEMQARHARAAELLDRLTRFDRRVLTAAFASAAEAERTAVRVRLAVSVACLVLVVGLTLGISRSVLHSLANLTAGFNRFGRGEFAAPIPITSRDEIGDVAEQANRMAKSLERLGAERNRIDWLKSGGAGLAQELHGELDPDQAADRALAFLARYLGAPVGALYCFEDADTLRLWGSYALGGKAVDVAVPTFRRGEGVVGQAALQTELTILDTATDSPDGAKESEHLRIRSGTIDGAPRSIACLPLIHAGKVTGVLELASLEAWTDVATEFLLSVRGTLAIAIEVARGRAAQRTLLSETQRQAERLSTQEEALRAANQELQAQKGALQQSNADLAHKASELEDQRHVLEEKNIALMDARLRLEQKAEELTSASAYKSQFLANMSHELRTPLNAIIGFAELLHAGEIAPDMPQFKEFLGDIVSSGRHLLHLINDVLDLSKVEAGKLEFRPEPLRLDVLVPEVLGLLGTTAATKHVQVEAVIDPTLQDIVLDPARTKQILYNYVSNAIKFTPAGGHVTVRAIAEGHEAWRLQVEDTGIGISPEDVKRLFIEFQQLGGPAARREGGTGLGLALTRRLVEAQGGTVGVHSTLGEGSAFFAVLPRKSRQQTVVLERPALPLLATGGPAVLIIEDEPRDQAQFMEVLSRAGYDVEVASTGAQAIARCKVREFAAITLDMLLPDMNGREVLRAIRAEGLNRNVPAIVITVVAEPGAVAGFAVHDILRKPLEPRALLSALQRAGGPPGPEGSVLVVDDDPNALKLLGVTLSQLGHRAVLERDPEQGLRAALRSPPSVIILDLLMPGMDGFEFLDRLRREPAGRGVPVIVWTGKDLSKEEQERLRASARAIVAKGHGVAAVAAELQACLRKRPAKE